MHFIVLSTTWVVFSLLPVNETAFRSTFRSRPTYFVVTYRLYTTAVYTYVGLHNVCETRSARDGLLTRYDTPFLYEYCCQRKAVASVVVVFGTRFTRAARPVAFSFRRQPPSTDRREPDIITGNSEKIIVLIFFVFRRPLRFEYVIVRRQRMRRPAFRRTDFVRWLAGARACACSRTKTLTARATRMATANNIVME